MTSVLPAIRSFLTNEENKLAKVFGKADGQDKVLKFIGEAAFPAAIEIASSAGASDSTLTGLGIGREVVITSRTVTGLFNVFRASIPIAYNAAKKTGELAVDLAKGEAQATALKNPKKTNLSFPEVLRYVDQDGQQHEIQRARFVSYEPSLSTVVSNPENFKYIDEHGKEYKIQQAQSVSHTAPPTHNEVAHGRRERLLQMGVHSMKFVGAATYITAFGVAAPCRFLNSLNTYVKDPEEAPIVELSPVGKTLAGSMTHIMFVNHISGVIENSCRLAYEGVAYNRAIQQGGDQRQIFQDYYKKVKEATVGLVEKILETLKDVLSLFSPIPMPVWFRIPFSTLTLSIGLYRVWIKTT